ncbi:nucleic-acid-binding protein from transposon X-element [Trichonephila clavipes]|nr:nucleic-acid-binding protein from transposon X-element [Trichonephila clavipes]
MSEKAGDIEENMEESHSESEFIEVTPEQACNNLQLLWGLARSKEAKLNYIKAELAIQEKTPIFNEEKIVNFNKDKAMLEQELQSALGEIALISCPIDNCKIHYPRGNNANDANTKPKPDLKLKNLNTKNNNDRINQVKRSGSEELKLPKKTARTIKEIPVEQVICSKKNQFAVLKVEENPSMEESSDPTPPQPKPIMLRLVKEYNLIIQEINRKFPATVNKVTGKYIKVQPGSIDDHRDITALLEAKKAEHYVIERLANQPIKVVIKGLPVDTDVADIEADLLQKGFAIGKVVQLRKFSTKAPLPIFMVEVRRTETAHDIYEVNSICYLCVTIDPFRRKPGVTQCYNCNFFNHSSKNCKMNPRCLNCGKNHRTGECTTKEKIDMH